LAAYGQSDSRIVFSSGETPSHAIGAVEQLANDGPLESVEFNADSMESEVKGAEF
jgi:hypothetical protein